MFFANRSLTGLFICAFMFCCSVCANANDIAEALQQKIELQTAELDILKAQLELESWTCSQVQDFHNKGFASWLEMRRQQLNVEAVRARVNSATEFHNFLNQVAAESAAASGDELVPLRQRTSKPVKVFIPGSVRLIGWIEGADFADFETENAAQQHVAIAEKKLARAQQRFDVVGESSSSDHHRQIALLRLNVAKAEWEHAKLINKSYTVTKADVAEMSVSLENLQQYVMADHNPDLAIATANVASTEINAASHIGLAQSMLERQQQRVAAFQELHSQGVASNNELESAKQRLSSIQTQLDAYNKQREILVQAVATKPVAKPTPVEYRAVNSWPSVVLLDDEFMLHLIGLREKFYDEQANQLIAENRLALLNEVLPRLKEAVLPAENINTEFQLTLQEGQLNEIRSYESETEIISAAAVSAGEKKRLLVLEETRFVLQAVTQYEASRESLAAANSNPATAMALLSLTTSPARILVGNHPNTTAPRFSYLESGTAFDLNNSTSLLFSCQNLDFAGSPYAANSLYRFTLRPAPDLMLAGDSLNSYSKASGLALEPDWMNYFRQNYERNAYSILPYGVRSYTRYYPNVNYGFSRSRPFGTYSAYPNGILRNDLRSRITPGQVPWYFPGSPANIRRNQLPYSYGRQNR